MSSSRLVKPPPTTDAELIRALEQRIKQLETKQTARFGDWVVHSTDGRLLATKPGEVLDVGEPVADVVDIGAQRGEALTEEEITAAITGIPGPLGDIVDFLGSKWTDLNSAANTLATLITNLLTAPATVLGQIPKAIVSGLDGALSLLQAGINGASQFVQNVINALWSALRGIPLIGGLIPGKPTPPTVTELESVLKDSQVNQQNFTISALASTYRNPSWVCRYPIADTTFPEFMFASFGTSGSSGPASAGTVHTHTAGTYTAALGGAAIEVNESRGGFVSISNTTVIDTVGLNIWYDSVDPAPTNVFLEIFREQADKSLVRVFVYNIAPILTGGTEYREIPVSPGLIVLAGERYLVRVRNSSSATKILVVSITQGLGSIDTSFKTEGATDTNRTTYTTAQAATGISLGVFLPWAMLAAKNLVEADVSYSDDFNRANLGPDWFNFGASPLIIVGNEAAYNGTTNGDQTMLYIRRTSGNPAKVDGNLHIGPDATTQRLGLILHANRELTRFAYLSATGTDARIYSYAGGVLTERASVATGGTDLYSMYYEEATDSYIALKGGESFGLQWSGISAVLPPDQDNRFGGIRISRAGSVNAGTVDNFTLSDWVRAPITIAAERMEATAAMPTPMVTAGIPVSRMEATAAMPVPMVGAAVLPPPMTATADVVDPAVSDNTHFPYTFPFPLT